MSTSDMFGDDDNLDMQRALDSLTLSKAHRWEGMLNTLITSTMATLRRNGITEEASELLAPSVVLDLCNAIGGQIVYFPRGTVLRRALRDVRVYRDWSERNMGPQELAARYHLSVQTVYEIIAKQREIARRASPDLFGYDDTAT